MRKVIVVGTLAFDTIETPFGKVERVIGGSAPFASLAAKTKNIECAIVSIVGNDFPKSYLDLLVSKEIEFHGRTKVTTYPHITSKASCLDEPHSHTLVLV